MEVKVRIFDIEWDTDRDNEIKETLPKEFTTTFDIDTENFVCDVDDLEEFETELRNDLDFYVDTYLTEQTGFCYFGYQLDFDY